MQITGSNNMKIADPDCVTNTVIKWNEDNITELQRKSIGYSGPFHTFIELVKVTLMDFPFVAL